MKLKLSEIIFDAEVYPRIEKDDEKINLYRQAIDLLPPIIISKNKKLIDGYHRLVVYRLEQKKEIEVEVLDITEDQDIYLEALKRNSSYGMQLNLVEKKSAAIVLYEKYKFTQAKIAKILSVTQQAISNYIKDLIKIKTEERNRLIIDLYLKCYPEHDIAKRLKKAGHGNLTRRQVSNIIKDTEKFTNFCKISIDNPARSNAWKQFNLDKSQIKFKGQLPKELVQNIIYYYTEPRDIVIDPMAGSGITGVVCKEMGRRYKLYDIGPIHEGIEQNDILKRIPKLKINRLADLIFFDPWYFSLLKDDYPPSKFTESYDSFLDSIKKATNNCLPVLKKGGRLVLLMKPMREKLYEGRWLPSSRDSSILIQGNGFELIQEISAPLSFHETFSPHQVKEAEERKVLLNIVNHILVFRRM